MANIGRNEPCSCGSGNKYKRCCGPKDQAQAAESAARTAQAEAQAALAAKEELRRGREVARAMMGDPRYVIEDDDLDETSNRVGDLLREGKIDEAEVVARDLLERYPEVPDGLMRLGAVYRARGDHPLAASYLRRAADFMDAAGPDFEPENAASLREEADELDPVPPAAGHR